MAKYLNSKQENFFRTFRKLADERIAQMVESPVEINENLDAIRNWKPASYTIDDIRLYEGNPYKCVQAHDSSNNEAWNPTVASLWIQYHGTTPETARAWVAPTGAHDMYKAGEYMIYIDGLKYSCVQDTTYSPSDYPNAWKVVE